MVDALSHAAAGLLNAQRRATDLAVEILKSSPGNESFADEKALEEDQNPDPAIEITSGDAGRPLAQQIVELKSAEIEFKASAAAFSKTVEIQDEFLGTVFEEES